MYGPIVLAGRLGTAGLTPDAQIIVNERTSGNMLNAAIEVPTLAGTAADLLRADAAGARCRAYLPDPRHRPAT